VGGVQVGFLANLVSVQHHLTPCAGTHSSPAAFPRMQCRHLKAVMSLGAGVDTLLRPGVVPEGVPILRIVRPEDDSTICLALGLRVESL
jgi:hypothetical protein